MSFVREAHETFLQVFPQILGSISHSKFRPTVQYPSLILSQRAADLLLAVDRYQSQNEALHEFSAASQIESREATAKLKHEKKRCQMLESDLKIAMEENEALSSLLALLAARVRSSLSLSSLSPLALALALALARSLSLLLLNLLHAS